MPRAPVTIATTRLVLTQPAPEDAARVLAYYELNRAHLEPWEPARTREFYSVRHWAERLRRNREDLQQDQALRLFLLLRPDARGRPADEVDPAHAAEGPTGDVVGSVNYTQFFRGPSMTCKLGFSLCHRHEGKGLMREALEASLDHVFDELGLHRVEAAYQPHNVRSGALLRRLGFVVEGYARDYLHLAGAWRDHLLTAKTNPRW